MSPILSLSFFDAGMVFTTKPKSEFTRESEIRISKSETNSNPEIQMSQTRRRSVWRFDIWNFGFVSDFEIRISSFRAAAKDSLQGPYAPQATCAAAGLLARLAGPARSRACGPAPRRGGRPRASPASIL